MQLQEETQASHRASGSATPRRLKIIRPPSLSPAVVINGISELIWYRDLLFTLTIHRIKVRYKQSALGLGWALLQPLSLMLVYTVIFSLFTRIPSDGSPYTLFVLTALLPWTFFQTALSSAATGLVSHTHLITKVYFPREILPITYVLAALFDFLIACVILGLMMAWYRVALTLETLLVVPILLIAIILTIGVALLLSTFQVKFRDIGIAMPLLLQLWMFATPVVYPLSQVPKRFQSFYIFNPMVGIVENFRRVAIQGIGPHLPSLLISASAALLILPVAYLLFKHRESTMADVI